MLSTYYRTEAMETYTCNEWAKEYHRKEAKRKAKQKAEQLYFMKQKLSGLSLILSGVIVPFIADGDVTFSLFIIPIGLFLVFTREHVMTFREGK